jgi:hypothetical protein
MLWMLVCRAHSGVQSHARAGNSVLLGTLLASGSATTHKH